MKFEVNIEEIVARGGDFSHVLGAASEQLRPAFAKAVQEAHSKEVVRDAKVRVADGTYTADDLVTLQRHLNDVKREKAKVAEEVKKENVKAAPKVSYPHAIERSEHDEIMKALGMANVVHKGQWR